MAYPEDSMGYYSDIGQYLNDKLNRKPATIAPTIKEQLMQIGELIKQSRKTAGLTQQQLAKKMKVTQGAIHQFEQSEDMQLSTLLKIAKALKVEMCELLQCKSSKVTGNGE